MKTAITSTAGNVNTTVASVANSIGGSDITTKTELVEGSSAFQTPNIAANANANNKRPLTLDLNKVITSTKQRLAAPPLLITDSVDLQNMKTLNTPDVEKIILSSNLLQTPQPGMVFPSKVGEVTSEQEEFGKGFEDALSNLRNSKNPLVQLNTSSDSTTSGASVNLPSTVTTAGNTGMSGGSITYTNLEPFPVAIKDEPQNPPSSPPVSPIDMETQEKIKLERKRQRNRVAASKCRKRKLERISKLEDKVKVLKGENTDLAQVVKSLKDHVAQLKQDVIQHMHSGCSINLQFTKYSDGSFMQSK